ncbi:lysylphosphatidylglycerol synthase transmembrane domain-containing protein [Candidatus Laterigemmans baculatus]|uniref:lysylphosphatidylglycerol synthase transmembrane domain-containing protein n=1 Tax=Candidatus Laterigemmans baculatus TaxID=2770505 RepID=UPI0013DB7FFF|nr:YbhN family protein [Candidatus Laterigemmans baculatus]
MFQRLRAIAGPLLGLILFAAAIVLLVREAQEIEWEDFVAGLTGVPRIYLAFAALLIALNYCLLMTYDLLALRYVRRALPLRRVALVGFLGYALGNNLGTLIAATPLRFRFYSSWGVPPRQVMAICILLGLTFWSGVSWLGGIVLLAVPLELPAGIDLPVSTRVLGGCLLSLGIFYAAVCIFWQRPLPIRTLHVRPPRPSLMGLQTSVAMLDLTISATALYLVLPPTATVPFALVLAAYLVGIAASLLTQIPGGLVVLELILLKLLEDSVGKAVIGSLLIFRLMYYVAPLLIAVPVLFIYELLRARAARRQAKEVLSTKY